MLKELELILSFVFLVDREDQLVKLGEFVEVLHCNTTFFIFDPPVSLAEYDTV